MTVSALGGRDERVELTVMAGTREEQGAEAVRWTLERILEPHAIEEPAMMYRTTAAVIVLYLRGGAPERRNVRSLTDPDIRLQFEMTEDLPFPIPELRDGTTCRMRHRRKRNRLASWSDDGP